MKKPKAQKCFNCGLEAQVPHKRKRRTAKELALWALGGSYDAHRVSRDFHEKRMKEESRE